MVNYIHNKGEKVMKKVFVVTGLFQSEDDFNGDAEAFVVMLEGKKLAEFGDDYHDKGQDKAEGFIFGYSKAMNYDYEIKYSASVISDKEE